MNLKRFHLILGLATLLTFIGTGMFMRITHPGMAGVDPAQRIFFRSRHIYILAIASVHLMLGAYSTGAQSTFRKTLQRIGSLLLTLSSVLLIAAFFRENAALVPNLPLSVHGLFSLLGGTLLHLLAAPREQKLGGERAS